MATRESAAKPARAVSSAARAEHCRWRYEQAFTALTDTRFYGLNAGIPSLCFGANAEVMHGFNERVDLTSLRETTKALAFFTADWCGIGQGRG